MRANVVTAGAAAAIAILAVVIAASGSMIRAPTVRNPPVAPPAASISSLEVKKNDVPTPSAPEAVSKPPEVASNVGVLPERTEPDGSFGDNTASDTSQQSKSPDDWKATILFNPVATAAGIIEAKGYSVTMKGVAPVQPDETCSFADRDWPCGLRARSAFRAWLRGRAVTCVVPPKPEPDAIVADCILGKQDIGAWLVARGWARPKGEAYAELASAAAKEAKGIFGAPGAMEAPTSSIVQNTLPSPNESGFILAPNTAGQDEVFPPKPPAPSQSIVTLPAAPTAPAQ